ncbi:hypothetical protein N8I84_41255 (plasmid) [Streptomyces cynarae]|uniref:Uncharacterized protein n=1 Tax=Streptomyces cynarae TaxID=2981134 RepID=A0ABY6EDZ9_9ACTN|nr:hypothetical protein [Streptomyces cynarae]UXY24879.1 hypothetical protein N8I84_41255 [Streptomyces cynarae]
MFEENIAVVLIFMIVLAAACYAIYHLKSKPVRVAAVIGALAALVGALTPVVRAIVEQPVSPNTSTVAPGSPNGPEGTPSLPVTSPPALANGSTESSAGK